MTVRKSTSKGHGGPRPGSGRPRVAPRTQISLSSDRKRDLSAWARAQGVTVRAAVDTAIAILTGGHFDRLTNLKELRQYAGKIDDIFCDGDGQVLIDAALEIEHLRAEVARLRVPARE